MSSLKRRFIPFADFNPDAPEIDVPQLELAENVVPLFGSYRSLRKATVISTQADNDPCSGAQSHLVTEEEYGKIFCRPDEYGPTAPTWDGFAAVPAYLGDQVDDGENTPWLTIDDSGSDDGDYIVAGHRESGDKAEARFGLTTPSATPEQTTGGVGTEHKLRFRYQTLGLDVPTGNSTRIDVDLRDDVGSVFSKSYIPAAGNDALPVEEVEDIDITGHNENALEIRFDVWQTGAEPQQEISPVATIQRDNWEKDDNGDITVDNIHQAIDEPSPADDDDFIISDWVGLDEDETPGSSTVEFRLEEIIRPPRLDEGTWEMWVRYKHKYEKEGASLTLYIQYLDGTRHVDIIDPIVLPEPTTSFQTSKQDISSGDWANVPLDKWGDIRVRLNYRYTGDPEAGDPVLTEQVLRATNRKSGVNGWQASSGSTTNANMTAAFGFGGNHLERQSDDNQRSSVRFDTFETAGGDPIESPADSDEKLSVKYKYNVTDTTEETNWVPWRIYIKGYVYQTTEERTIAQWNVQGRRRNGFREYEHDGDGGDNSTAATARTMTWARGQDIDWDTLWVELEKREDAQEDDDWNLEIKEFELTVPGTPSDQNKCSVSWLYSEMPSGAQVRIQKAEVQLTAEATEEHLPGDIPVITVGTRTKLYNVDHTGTWSDVTRGTPYDQNYPPGTGTTLNVPKGWSFTTYGNRIIASNYHDVLQVYDWGASTFLDLTNGAAGANQPVDVMGRFVATIRSFLVVANINPDSYGGSGAAANDARGYTIWWSAIGDPEKFYELDEGSLSTYAQLVSLPGEITGLVGGEYGVVFKRNSVWRMNWVGASAGLWSFDQISANTGCAYPRSIVSVGNTIYFWGSTGIFVLDDAAQTARSGQMVQKISTQIMDKYLFDGAFEDKSVRMPTSNQDVENVSVVSAGYDPYSGLVWWAYVRKGDPYYECNEILVYNPNDGRFSTVSPSDNLQVQAVVGIGNTYEEENSYTRALALITNDPTASDSLAFQKFQSEEMYPATLKTKTLSSEMIARAPGRQIQLNQIRPVFRVNPEDGGNPNIQITVDTAEDPSFQLNKTTNSVNFDERNRDGWCPITTPLSGEFFEFTVSVPSTNEYILKEFLGLQVLYKDQGEI